MRSSALFSVLILVYLCCETFRIHTFDTFNISLSFFDFSMFFKYCTSYLVHLEQSKVKNIFCQISMQIEKSAEKCASLLMKSASTFLFGK